MIDLESLLVRLETLIAEVEELDEPLRGRVFELLDGIDALHRMALEDLGDALGGEQLDQLRATSAAVAWLLDAYDVGGGPVPGDPPPGATLLPIASR